MTTSDWEFTSLCDVLSPVSRAVRVDPHAEYTLLGARWYAKGLYPKERKFGSEIKASKLYRVQENDFVYNRLFAWKGSFAVASGENADCFVSNEFPCFVARSERLDPRFLWYHFNRQDSWDEALGLSQGATPTSRNRLKEEHFLSLRIRLPKIDDQKRIVAKLDELASRVSEVARLRDEATTASDQLCRSILRDKRFGEPTPTPMRELVTLRKCDTKVSATGSYSFAGVYCFGRGVFRGQRRAGSEFAYSQLTRIRAGEFIYPKLMAWEGALAVVPDECDGLFVSPEFPVFSINTDKVLPEVLDVYFRSPAVWPLLSGSSTGTNVRRKRLNPSDFLRYEFPLPSREAQFVLRNVRRKLTNLGAASNQTSQLEALLPSILDRAFKGEL
jgi:type I restriction enzyme S subunit